MFDKSVFQNNLLEWFERHQRELPWRRNYEPYHVWVSEIMLQQTQMDRVVEYFGRWIKRFPDLCSVATAREDEILQLWEGLGYYSRARNLHKAAKRLCAGDRGVPEQHEALLALPGIGKYTAGAIMSIAYNREYPVVDGNVERVFSRIFNIESPVKDRDSQGFIWETAEGLIPPGRARMFNQGLMELGALICTPHRPQCPACPVSEQCESLRLGIVDERPVPGKSTDIIRIKMATGVLFHEGKVFIQKRPENGIWANLWEFPGGRVEKGERMQAALVREFMEETEFRVKVLGRISDFNHSYTRYRVRMHSFACVLDQAAHTIPVLHEAQEYAWVTPDALDGYAFPSVHRKLIRHLTENDLFSAQAFG